MLSPLLVLCLRTEYYLHDMYVGCIKINLSKGDTVFISSDSSMLSVLFSCPSNMSATLFVENEPYKEIKDLSNTYGFDFGTAVGSVLFTAFKNFTNFVISAIVYPQFCIESRFISTNSKQIFSFNKNSTKQEFLISDKQTICFWHAISPINHQFSIDYNTEELLDVFKIYTSGQLTAELSGNGTKHYQTNTSVFFAWTTDHSELSDHFTLTSIGERVHPNFFEHLIANKTTDVTVFEISVAIFEPEIVPEIPKIKYIKWKDIMPFVFAMALASLLAAVFSIIWCYKYRKNIISPDYDTMHPKTGYDMASERGQMPMPVIQVSVPSENELEDLS